MFECLKDFGSWLAIAFYLCPTAAAVYGINRLLYVSDHSALLLKVDHVIFIFFSSRCRGSWFFLGASCLCL